MIRILYYIIVCYIKAVVPGQLRGADGRHQLAGLLHADQRRLQVLLLLLLLLLL